MEIPPEKETPGAFSLMGTASVMGLHMVSGPIAGAGLGWLVDEWFGTWPVASSVGLILGLAAGFRNVWIDARYLIRSNTEADAKAVTEKNPAQIIKQDSRKRLVPDSMKDMDSGLSDREEEELAGLIASIQAQIAQRDTASLKGNQMEKREPYGNNRTS